MDLWIRALTWDLDLAWLTQAYWLGPRFMDLVLTWTYQLEVGNPPYSVSIFNGSTLNSEKYVTFMYFLPSSYCDLVRWADNTFVQCAPIRNNDSYFLRLDQIFLHIFGSRYETSEITQTVHIIFKTCNAIFCSWIFFSSNKKKTDTAAGQRTIKFINFFVSVYYDDVAGSSFCRPQCKWERSLSRWWGEGH